MWGVKMSRLQLYYNVLKYFLTGNTVKASDIANSYNAVSSGYDNEFVKVMHRYNVSMLSMLNVPPEARILDLACGTGFNSEWLLHNHPDAVIDGTDISEGMLQQADRKLGGRVRLSQASMLDFLGQCKAETYDVVVCSWAIKYQTPLEVLQECCRVLKKGGQIGVIVNSKATLPEIRKIYKYLLINNSAKTKKLMMELPNPRNKEQLYRWFRASGFTDIKTSGGFHKFRFESSRDAAEWVTSTGALAGFDVMLDLREAGMKEQISQLLDSFDITSITHDFVIGVAEKC